MAFRKHPLTKRVMTKAHIQYQDHPSGEWVTVETVTDRDKVAERLEFHRVKYGVQLWRVRRTWKDNPDHGRFTKGTRVRVSAEVDAGEAAFGFGVVVTVDKAGGMLGVAWNQDETIVRRFPVEYLEPMDESEGE